MEYVKTLLIVIMVFVEACIFYFYGLRDGKNKATESLKREQAEREKNELIKKNTERIINNENRLFDLTFGVNNIHGKIFERINRLEKFTGIDEKEEKQNEQR